MSSGFVPLWTGNDIEQPRMPYQEIQCYLEKGLGVGWREVWLNIMEAGTLYRVTGHYLGNFAGELQASSLSSWGVFKVVLVETGELQPGQMIEIFAPHAHFHVVRPITNAAPITRAAPDGGSAA